MHCTYLGRPRSRRPLDHGTRTRNAQRDARRGHAAPLPHVDDHLTHRLTEDGTVCGTGDKVGARVSMVPKLWSFLAKGAQEQRPSRRILDVLDQHHAPNAWDTDSPAS